MPFLTASWRKLMMANYVVPPELLQPFVPNGTVLDYWQDQCYMSLVGFMFLDTKLLGVPIPFHRDFEEVNLRFYVRRKVGAEWRRGAVFIKEIVPKPAISLVANVAYSENYETHRMRHQWKFGPDEMTVAYEWKPFFKGNWYTMAATAESKAQPILIDSKEEFITEHYWGYARIDAHKTNEYQVQHPRWEVYKVHSHNINGDFSSLYGADFAAFIAAGPDSVFVAEGSEISVLGKARI